MVEHRTQAVGLELAATDVRELCGDLLDWKLKAILALNPTAAEVAAAVAWANGGDELGQEGHPLAGVTAQVYDLLLTDESYGEEG